MKLTKDQKELLNVTIDRYMDTLNKINQTLRNDAVNFSDKKDLLNMLDVAIAKTWIDWTDGQNNKTGG